MIADLKPYADYQDSGPSWLGEVPAHWQIVRSKRLFTARKELARPDDVQLSATQAYGVIAQSLYEERTGYRVVKISMHLDKRRHVERDDFIISMRSFQGGLERAWSTGAIRSSYVVLKPEGQVDAAYFKHLFKSVPYIAALRATGDFIRDGQDLNYTNFCGVDLPLVPLPEQAAIGRFLDWANGQLDRTIRAKRKTIALLAEQMQSITQQAVSCGTDSTVQLRPSGIQLFGEIPQHWEVRPLKAVSVIQSGVTLGKDYGSQQTREFPYLRVANVQAGFVNLSVVKKIRVPIAEARRSTVAVGDVLMTEGGDPDKLGRGCVWDGQVSPCLHQNHVFAVRPDQQRLEPRFLSAFMGTNSARAYFQSTAKQTTNLASTNKTKIGRLQVPLPPIDEQRAILEAVAARTQPASAAIARLETEIKLLREYRIRLVAEIVTGKLDVRDAAARLPDAVSVDRPEDSGDDSGDTELAAARAAIAFAFDHSAIDDRLNFNLLMVGPMADAFHRQAATRTDFVLFCHINHFLANWQLRVISALRCWLVRLLSAAFLRRNG